MASTSGEGDVQGHTLVEKQVRDPSEWKKNQAKRKPNTGQEYIQNKKMATPNPASESPSVERTTNVPMSDCCFIGDTKCLNTSLNFFFINFCNRSPSLEISLFTTSFGFPHLLLTILMVAFNFAILHDLEQLV
ncbi:hypothetical protein E2C01_046584 [Portunus trituberculatus]|uniref:Uncharacterized protein n=1 Tax=Portunus trituberculatus TaxID=210409 RepID=A0A5B7G6J8_PORTR|nr:hypothetical protein [Portunus trituberculatus]